MYKKTRFDVIQRSRGNRRRGDKEVNNPVAENVDPRGFGDGCTLSLEQQSAVEQSRQDRHNNGCFVVGTPSASSKGRVTLMRYTWRIRRRRGYEAVKRTAPAKPETELPTMAVDQTCVVEDMKERNRRNDFIMVLFSWQRDICDKDKFQKQR